LPYTDIRFEKARKARDVKRRELQSDLKKRKESCSALTEVEYKKIINCWDEDTSSGLQHFFFFISHHTNYTYWRGGEATYCLLHYLKEETDNSGRFTGRLEYNPLFSKTEQGGSKRLSQSKFLITNATNTNICPVR
jgi:hypothetical protein